MVYGVPATFSGQMYLDNSVLLINCSSLKLTEKYIFIFVNLMCTFVVFRTKKNNLNT